MCLSIGMLLAAAAATANDVPRWSGFRGPNGSGVSPAAKPPVKIGPKENVLWKTELPWSPSSPCVWGDRLFLTTFHEGKLETRCYDRREGRLLWTRAATTGQIEEFHQTEGSPAASTPVTDGQRVVVYFGSYGLLCYDMDGKGLWTHPMGTAATAGNFGSGTSPILAGDLVVLNRDLAKNSILLAVRLKDGTKAWESPRPEAPTSYGTPIVWRSQETEEIVVPGSLQLKGYDLRTGAERWTVRRMPSFVCTTPVVGDGALLFGGWSPGKGDAPWPRWEGVVEKQDKNGDGVLTVDEFQDGPVWFKSQDIDGDGKLEREDWEIIGGLMKKGENVLVSVRPGGQGDITETHVAWRYERGLPYVPSPLYYQGRIYMVKDGGMLTCVDAASGTAVYAQERLNALGGYYASPVAADGRIYLCSLNGIVTVVQAGGDKPSILHQADFGERIAGTPALVEDKLYLRTQTRLYAFGP